jgi:hypothetical protein
MHDRKSEKGKQELAAQQRRFQFAVEDAKRDFGQWDMCDPVSWAILRVVEAQNDLAHVIGLVACEGINGRVLEEAIAERIKAIAALQKAIEEEPRGFHVAPGARLRGDERRNKTYVPRFVALYKQSGNWRDADGSQRAGLRRHSGYVRVRCRALP